MPSTTLNLPYPCDDKKSEQLIREYIHEQTKNTSIRWALTITKKTQHIIGGIRLVPNFKFNSAELGFWIGKSYWRNGYSFEAAARVVEFGFKEMELNRIEAHSMAENLSSINLLKKLGFKQEGYHPDLVMKWGNYKDVITFGLLRKHHLHRN